MARLQKIEGSWGIDPVPARLRVHSGLDYAYSDVFGTPAWRPGLIAAWLAGFTLYQWLYPTGPSWWVDLLAKLGPPGWGIGATVLSFLVSFGLASIVAHVLRRAVALGADA